MSFNFNDWYNQISQSQGQDPNMNYGGPANNYDYYGLNSQGQGQQQPQGPGMSTNPGGYPDLYGGGNAIGATSNMGMSPSGGGADWWNQPTGGTYTDEFGNQQPNTPISHMGGSTGPYGAPSTFNGQQVDYGQGSGGGKVRDPMTGQMVDPYNGPSATSGQDLFNNPGGFPAATPNSKIPNATDNYGPGMIDAMNKSAAAAAQSQLAPQLPPTGAGAGAAGGKPIYNNLYGGDIAGAQLGFNELNGKQFTDTGNDFKSVFGSTQGQGMGNNYNWNVYPQFSADQLDPAAQQQIVAIAQANPQYDFEPTMVNGKWVLASRARDISQQKSLLAPQLPPTATGGGGGGSGYGGGAKTSSGGGYTKYPTGGGGGGSSSGGGGGGMTQAQQQQLIKGVHTVMMPAINAAARVKSGAEPAGSNNYGNSPQAQGPAAVAPNLPPLPPAQGQLPAGQRNAPYVPVSGTGAGYDGPAQPYQWWANVPSAPPPTATPPEGAIRVNPDDSRSVWHNGQWQLIPGINS